MRSSPGRSSWPLVPVLLCAACSVPTSRADEPGHASALERDFRELPMSARRLTGPLFWLHGDESPELLRAELDKVAEGGNGCFTAESRPHSDWLGPGWYRDLGVCLDAARELGLQMWIFDEKWWPSGEVAGRVPPQFASKRLQVSVFGSAGPARIEFPVATGRFIALLAGRYEDGGVVGETLIDLSDQVQDGRIVWKVPDGFWQLMEFTWEPLLDRQPGPLVDGASQDAVDWYIQTVYAPHFERFGEAFGREIVGYFYDEPETHGDWGSEVPKVLAERGVDWRKALVAWKCKLAGEEQAAASYQYRFALAEAWGRTLYGGIARWCREHGVRSIGHFLEHDWEYLDPRLCAGDMVQLQKYSDMGAIDAVFRQFAPGTRDPGLWQTPKLGSSISHVYGKQDDLAMVEIFGARGQDLSYPEMKWWTDHMHVSGINFHIPHSFNPRAPNDLDCPPYFYNGGREPRWPLYRVYADYTSRLSLMLSGGAHVCPVALLYLGQSDHVGRAVRPEALTTALQDALIDCDWLPYEVLERDVSIADGELALHQERYRVLAVPPVEVIPYETLAKAREFFEAGGVVIGQEFLPSASATLGRSSGEIAALRDAIWGPTPKAGSRVVHTNFAGGRAYFLPAEVRPADLQAVLADAGVPPTVEVVSGDTGGWVHALQRRRDGRDVFFVTNQHHEGQAQSFTFRLRARGTPECWDPMRGEVDSLEWRRIDSETAEVELTLEPLEGVLIVFDQQSRTRPRRIGPETKPVREPIAVTRLASPTAPSAGKEEEGEAARLLHDCRWVWFPEGDHQQGVRPGPRFFRRRITLPPDAEVRAASFFLTADNAFELFVDGQSAGAGSEWQHLETLDLGAHLHAGENLLAIAATNAGSGLNPAGLIGRLQVVLESGVELELAIDATWKALDHEVAGWKAPDLDDSTWPAVQEGPRHGSGPWGAVGETMTLSPVVADPFNGRVTLPPDVDLGRVRVCLELEELQPEGAARVTVNGLDAGGFIGRPFRLDVTRFLSQGENTVLIEPFAPRVARLAFY